MPFCLKHHQSYGMGEYCVYCGSPSNVIPPAKPQHDIPPFTIPKESRPTSDVMPKPPGWTVDKLPLSKEEAENAIRKTKESIFKDTAKEFIDRYFPFPPPPTCLHTRVLNDTGGVRCMNCGLLLQKDQPSTTGQEPYTTY